MSRKEESKKKATWVFVGGFGEEKIHAQTDEKASSGRGKKDLD